MGSTERPRDGEDDMTTTIENLTDAQIRSLRAEASDAGDHEMVAICDLALDGEIDTDDYSTLDRDEARRVRCMSRDEAYAEIVEAIDLARAAR